MAAGYWKSADATIRRVLAHVRVDAAAGGDLVSVETKVLVEVRPHEQKLGGNRIRATRDMVLGAPIFLDDTDGQGWRHATIGRGSPSWNTPQYTESQVRVVQSLPDGPE